MKIITLIWFWWAPAFAATPPVSLNQLSLKQLFQVPAADGALLSTYFHLLAQVRSTGTSLEPWFREDHMTYLLDLLSEDERRDLTDVFRHLERRLGAGSLDLRDNLVTAGHALLVAKVSRLDADVRHLKRQHKAAIRLALFKHETELNLRYGGYRYSYHLRKVRGVLKRFGLGPKDSFLGLQLGTATWFHDIVEDTDLTYEQLVDIIGVEIADMVLGVTKLTKIPGVSSAELLRRTYARTALNRGSRLLKLADRIANVEEGLIRLFLGFPTKVVKYIDEWPVFKELLYRPGDHDAMWAHLEKLLTNLDYAQNFAKVHAHRLEELKALAACEQHLLTSPSG